MEPDCPEAPASPKPSEESRPPEPPHLHETPQTSKPKKTIKKRTEYVEERTPEHLVNLDERKEAVKWIQKITQASEKAGHFPVYVFKDKCVRYHPPSNLTKWTHVLSGESLNTVKGKTHLERGMKLRAFYNTKHPECAATVAAVLPNEKMAKAVTNKLLEVEKRKKLPVADLLQKAELVEEEIRNLLDTEQRSGKNGKGGKGPKKAPAAQRRNATIDAFRHAQTALDGASKTASTIREKEKLSYIPIVELSDQEQPPPFSKRDEGVSEDMKKADNIDHERVRDYLMSLSPAGAQSGMVSRTSPFPSGYGFSSGKHGSPEENVNLIAPKSVQSNSGSGEYPEQAFYSEKDNITGTEFEDGGFSAMASKMASNFSKDAIRPSSSRDMLVTRLDKPFSILGIPFKKASGGMDEDFGDDFLNEEAQSPTGDDKQRSPAPPDTGEFSEGGGSGGSPENTIERPRRKKQLQKEETEK